MFMPRLPAHHLRAQQRYTPYGFSPRSAQSALRLAGQWYDPLTGNYLLGNGYRSYHPTLMRFSSSDRPSPFADGGLNSYAYCAGDPVNRTDPSGASPVSTVPPGASLPRHYTARIATAVGSGAGVAIKLVEIAKQHQSAPNGYLSPVVRARNIAGTYALASGLVSDVIEVFLPPQAATRVGPVDSLGLAAAGLFGTDALIGLASAVAREGLAGVRVPWRSLAYAAGEVTLLGPALDTAGYAYSAARTHTLKWLASRGQPPAIALQAAHVREV